jgi:hypothetical protein
MRLPRWVSWDPESWEKVVQEDQRRAESSVPGIVTIRIIYGAQGVPKRVDLSLEDHRHLTRPDS